MADTNSLQDTTGLPRHAPLAGLILLLGATLGIKIAALQHPGALDTARMQRDLARSAAVSGYRLTRSPARIERYDAIFGTCRANIAVLDYASVNLPFLRNLHQAGFARHAELHGADRTASVPPTYVIHHYIARSLATLGFDWPVQPYVLAAWDAGCPMPLADQHDLTLHYRAD